MKKLIKGLVVIIFTVKINIIMPPSNKKLLSYQPKENNLISQKPTEERTSYESHSIYSGAEPILKSRIFKNLNSNKPKQSQNFLQPLKASAQESKIDIKKLSLELKYNRDIFTQKYFVKNGKKSKHYLEMKARVFHLGSYQRIKSYNKAIRLSMEKLLRRAYKYKISIFSQTIFNRFESETNILNSSPYLGKKPDPSSNLSGLMYYEYKINLGYKKYFIPPSKHLLFDNFGGFDVRAAIIQFLAKKGDFTDISKKSYDYLTKLILKTIKKVEA